MINKTIAVDLFNFQNEAEYLFLAKEKNGLKINYVTVFLRPRRTSTDVPRRYAAVLTFNPLKFTP